MYHYSFSKVWVAVIMLKIIRVNSSLHYAKEYSNNYMVTIIFDSYFCFWFVSVPIIYCNFKQSMVLQACMHTPEKKVRWFWNVVFLVPAPCPIPTRILLKEELVWTWSELLISVDVLTEDKQDMIQSHVTSIVGYHRKLYTAYVEHKRGSSALIRVIQASIIFHLVYLQ